MDALGAPSLLIGGTRQVTANGTVITPTANGVIVSNDADHPLFAPEILLVAAPQFRTRRSPSTTRATASRWRFPSPVPGRSWSGKVASSRRQGPAAVLPELNYILGSDLQSIGVLRTNASVSNSGATASIIEGYYQTLDSSLGTLVELSTGNVDSVQLPSAAQLSPGTIVVQDNLDANTVPFTIALPSLLGAAGGTGAVIQSGARIEGGNVLTLATTGDTTIQPGALLSGNNVTAISSSITFVGSGSGAAPTTGMVIDSATLAQLEQSTNLNLQSYGAIGFQGNVAIDMANAVATLTLGGNSLSGDGGQVTIAAPTVVLDNTLSIVAPGAPVAGTGSFVDHCRPIGVRRRRQVPQRLRYGESYGPAGDGRARHRQHEFRQPAGDAADTDPDRRHLLRPGFDDNRRSVGHSCRRVCRRRVRMRWAERSRCRVDRSPCRCLYKPRPATSRCRRARATSP